jgi:hypothetical protein
MTQRRHPLPRTFGAGAASFDQWRELGRTRGKPDPHSLRMSQAGLNAMSAGLIGRRQQTIPSVDEVVVAGAGFDRGRGLAAHDAFCSALLNSLAVKSASALRCLEQRRSQHGPRLDGLPRPPWRLRRGGCGCAKSVDRGAGPAAKPAREIHTQFVERIQRLARTAPREFEPVKADFASA